MAEGELDEKDKELLKFLCRDRSLSYSEIADRMGISRSTVYRRLKSLKGRGVIDKKDVSIPDFDRLDISTLWVGIRTPISDVDTAAEVLEEMERTKMVFTSYGEYDIYFLAVAEPEKGRELLSSARERLFEAGVEVQEVNVNEMKEWRKLDLVPY